MLRYDSRSGNFYEDNGNGGCEHPASRDESRSRRNDSSGRVMTALPKLFWCIVIALVIWKLIPATVGHRESKVPILNFWKKSEDAREKRKDDVICIECVFCRRHLEISGLNGVKSIDFACPCCGRIIHAEIR